MIARFEWPHIARRGNPLPTVENVQLVLREHGITPLSEGPDKRQQVLDVGRLLRDRYGIRVNRKHLAGYLEIIRLRWTA